LGKCRSRQQQCGEQKATDHAFSPKVILHIFNAFCRKAQKIKITSQSLRAFIFESPATTPMTRFMPAFERGGNLGREEHRQVEKIKAAGGARQDLITPNAST
jgi:hypothetical protein